MSTDTTHNWQDLAFSSKSAVNKLNAIFIAAPRSISVARFTQLLQTYLPLGNIVVGISEESHVIGFEDQPQFTMLQQSDIEQVLVKVSKASLKRSVHTLVYSQRDFKFLIDKLTFKRVVLVNGSWQYVFHTSEAYYALVNKHIPYDMVSPFTNETEAKAYEQDHSQPFIIKAGDYSDHEMMRIAADAAKQSYDYSFQTGVSLGVKTKKGYRFMTASFSQVVPYQTYAMHFGNSRELNFSVPNDLNHYDAIHAEANLIVEAQKQKLDLGGASVFINLLPCPTCARMLSRTDIIEVVYSSDHSNGYAIRLLEAAGKKVRRLV